MLHYTPRIDKHGSNRARQVPQRRMECPGCGKFKLCLMRATKRIWQCAECREAEDGRERA